MEIRWYSPFVQNEFIRGGRDGHCRESRCLCDKGWERQIGGKKKSFISCSSEAPTVSENQRRGCVKEEKTGETGRGPTECVREVNARIICQGKEESPSEKKMTEGRVERYVKFSYSVRSGKPLRLSVRLQIKSCEGVLKVTAAQTQSTGPGSLGPNSYKKEEKQEDTSAGKEMK